MVHRRDELQLIQAQMAHKKRLEAMLSELRSQHGPLQRKVTQLEKIKLEEQKDVDRLQGRSLAAFFYYVLGKRDEKLDEERKEAYAARVKYEAAARELEAINHDIRETEADLQLIGDCDARFAQLLEEKSATIKASALPEADEILKLEQTLAFLKGQEQELQEAITAGRQAVDISDTILDALDSAEDWSTLDLLGGGLLADIAKHDKLDEAQEAVEALQVQLQKLNKELADVTIRADIQLNIDTLLRFADFFFDNLFTDLAVRDRIAQALQQVHDTRSRVEEVLRQLVDTLESVWHRQIAVRQTLDALILRVEL